MDVTSQIKGSSALLMIKALSQLAMVYLSG